MDRLCLGQGGHLRMAQHGAQHQRKAEPKIGPCGAISPALKTRRAPGHKLPVLPCAPRRLLTQTRCCPGRGAGDKHTEAVLQCVTSSGVPGLEHFLVRYKPRPAGPLPQEALLSGPQHGAGSAPTAQPPAASHPPELRFHWTQPGLARQQLPLRLVPKFRARSHQQALLSAFRAPAEKTTVGAFPPHPDRHQFPSASRPVSPPPPTAPGQPLPPWSAASALAQWRQDRPTPHGAAQPSAQAPPPPFSRPLLTAPAPNAAQPPAASPHNPPSFPGTSPPPPDATTACGAGA